MRYVEVEHVPRSTALDDESNGDMVVRENNQSTSILRSITRSTP